MQNKIIKKGILFILLLMVCALPITPKTAIEHELKGVIVAAEEEKIGEAILETAATEEEIEEAIINGLAWLAEQQDDDGGWHPEAVWNRVGITGFMVLKMEDRAIELGYETPFDPDYEYSENVTKGLNFIFKYAYLPAEFPPEFPAIYFMHNTTPGNYHLNYETSLAMMAIAGSNTPDRIVDVPGAIYGLTYAEVVEYARNWLIFTQRVDGGWGYLHPGPWPEVNRSDNSNTGYAALALTYAETRFGIDIPLNVKEKLSLYIDYIQNDDGGSGYTTPDEWVNILKTGTLLFEMALVGDEVTDTRVQNAISYIENHWNDEGHHPDYFGVSYGWKDCYQAMFTMMKGFEAFGIEIITVGDTDITWFDEVSSVILGNQHVDGYFNWINTEIWTGEDSAILRTAWALLTLERVVEIPEIQANVDIKPGSWPNPINVKSKGVFTVAICGTENFDVLTIDPASVQIYIEGEEIGVSPLRWCYEDVATPYTGEEGGGHTLGGDCYTDLVLHFDTQEVVNILSLSQYAGDTIPLIIRGNLLEEYDGIPIEGQDYVWILQKKNK